MGKQKPDALTPAPASPEKPPAPKGPTEWLLESTRQLPAVKYAFGVVAVVAVAAISTGFFLTNWLMALYGGVAAFLGMLLVRLYAVSKPKSARIDVSLPVQVLVWTGVVAFVVVVGLGLVKLGMVTFASESGAGGNGNRNDNDSSGEVVLALPGEQGHLYEIGSLVAHLQNYRSRMAVDAETWIGQLADTQQGNLFLSRPLPDDCVDPLVLVRVRELNGDPPALAASTTTLEVFVIPRQPDQIGYRSGSLYLQGGDVRHQFTGSVPAGSTIVVVYAFDRDANVPPNRNLSVSVSTRS